MHTIIQALLPPNTPLNDQPITALENQWRKTLFAVAEPNARATTGEDLPVHKMLMATPGKTPRKEILVDSALAVVHETGKCSNFSAWQCSQSEHKGAKISELLSQELESKNNPIVVKYRKDFLFFSVHLNLLHFKYWGCQTFQRL